MLCIARGDWLDYLVLFRLRLLAPPVGVAIGASLGLFDFESFACLLGRSLAVLGKLSLEFMRRSQFLFISY